MTESGKRGRDVPEMEIAPGKGLMPVYFGSTPAEVEHLLGEPAEVTRFEDDANPTISISYQGVTFFFHQSENFLLSSVEVDLDSGCKLFGEPLFPRSRRQLIGLLNRHLPEGWMSEIKEGRDEILEEAHLSLPSLQMTFYFDLADQLQELQWNVFVGADDEIAWPDESAGGR